MQGRGLPQGGRYRQSSANRPELKTTASVRGGGVERDETPAVAGVSSHGALGGT
jgi:hypothetical protein